MSDAFDTNLLSQITALDRKMSISRERSNPSKRPKYDQHRKGGDHSPEPKAAALRQESQDDRSPGIDHTKIDITI